MTLPLGYRYAATYAGIRKEAKDDVGLICSDRLAAAAAVFTRNVVEAAPVQIARRHLRASGGKVAAILVNAGNANCATRTGESVAISSARAVAKSLKTKAKYVLTASTGVIGVELDPKLLIDAAAKLAARLSRIGFDAVARAMMTTDLRMKMSFEELVLRDGIIRIAGMTKGSGMIHPNMATTLGFVLTDADLPVKFLQKTLTAGIEHSYNSLSVDGDMSTNDMVVLMANGASKVKPRRTETELVVEKIGRVLDQLAEQIAADGEGARKLVIINTSGFRSDEDARTVARAIANSPLVKTAIAGSDPNWGRILAAAGYSGVLFDPRKVTITLQEAPVCRRGLAVDIDEAGLKQKLDASRVSVSLAVEGGGSGKARYFTCDLTEGYIRINGSYRT